MTHVPPRASSHRLAALLALLALPGCPSDPPATDAGTDAPPTDAPGTDTPGTDVPVDAGPPPAARTLASNGSAIAINAAGDVLVAANRQAGTISVFDVDTAAMPPTVTRTADLAVAGAEPWQVVMGNDDDSAYVILRATQEVVRVTDLHGTPTLGATRGRTGSEPTGLAISPLGDRLYAANWAEGTITVLDGALATVATIDLNGALVATGVLGGVTARPGLAHPRAITMTNDGDTDQTDETIYVTEYFGQNRTDTAGLPTDGSELDVARVGFVYRVGFDGTVGAAISLAPVTDTGFRDSVGNVTGCFPNQLQTATLNGGRLYVAGVCASPRGPTGPILNADGTLMSPANFKTEVHTTVWVVDTGANAEVPAQRLVLTDVFDDRYVAMSVADDATRRYPLIPTDFTFVPTSNIGYLTAYGSDAVFRIQYGADGTLTTVGSALNHFINLAPTGAGAPPAGRLPLGIAIPSSVAAFTINEASRNVSIITLATQAVVGATEATPMPPGGSAEEDVLLGRRFFVTGLGRWSFRGQAWNSCEACHGDGLTDNVTWHFARGPRQSTSLDGSYGPSGERRVFNWTAIFDETHDFELNTRGNSGGVGAIVHAASTPAVAGDRIHFDGTSPTPPGNMATAASQAGLTGSTTDLMPGGAVTPSSVLSDWDEIDAYLASIRAPRAPTNLAAADVTAGRALFESNGCAGCHGTDMWTTSRVFYTPGATDTGAAAGLIRSVTYSRPSAFPASLNPPTASGPATLRGTTGGEQINCILSAVGTFPATGTTPILPSGSNVLLREVRADMTTAAQGVTGFNPPALVGMMTGAPYFHGGNARTLEEVFDATFAAHYQAFSVNFLTSGDRAAQVRQMVAFLLSIDDDTAAAPAPALGFDFTLCPDTL